MSHSRSTLSLRDHLVTSLSALFTPFDLDLTVVSSVPKRTNSLFPHARHPPKCYEKQYVITLGATLPPLTSTPIDQDGPSTSTSSDPSAQASGSSKAPRKVLVSALHAYLYTTSHRRTIYISKVDTSGYLPSSSPATKTLITSFILYHLHPEVAHDAKVQVQLFARSQGQYLFPNSSQGSGKRVAGGLKLCAWWKGVYEAVAIARARQQSSSETENGEPLASGEDTAQRIHRTQRMHLRYLLPSYSGDEAAGMLGAPKVLLPPNLHWTYGPPFTTPFDSRSEGSDSSNSLGLMIPSLPDDPKTRFLDELVAEAGPSRRQDNPTSRGSNGTVSTDSNGIAARPTEADVEDGTDTDTPGPTLKVDDSRVLGPRSSGATLVETPKRKPKTGPSHKEKEQERDDADRRTAETALSKISHLEFWERMGFRQECISGDVTGFFTLELDPPAAMTLDSVRTNGGNGSTSLSRVLGETSSTATVIDTPHDPQLAPAPSLNGNTSTKASSRVTSTMDIPYGLVDRVLTSLLNCDFASLSLALESTQIWSDGVKGILVGEIGEKGWEDSTACIPATVGGVGIKEKRKEEVVTMLQPRKKKKV